jgi:hypothetical protein
LSGGHRSRKDKKGKKGRKERKRRKEEREEREEGQEGREEPNNAKIEMNMLESIGIDTIHVYSLYTAIYL